MVLRPWEAMAGRLPWQAGQIYVRTIAVHRPNQAPAKGLIAYQGQTLSDETVVTFNGVVMSGITCSIQHFRIGRSVKADLPADPTGRAQWTIYIPAALGPLGSIMRGDIIVDDLNIRYQVQKPYWNILGYRLETEQVQV